jgi:hypothetical protein
MRGWGRKWSLSGNSTNQELGQWPGCTTCKPSMHSNEWLNISGQSTNILPRRYGR